MVIVFFSFSLFFSSKSVSLSPVLIGYLSPEMQLIDQGVVSKEAVIKNHELLMPAL